MFLSASLAAIHCTINFAYFEKYFILRDNFNKQNIKKHLKTKILFNGTLFAYLII